MLAGEYAVLAGAPAIAVAVRRYLRCRASEAPQFELQAMGLRWREGEPVPSPLLFAAEALRVGRSFLKGRRLEPAPLSLAIEDELRATDGRKLGLGGSACTAVAVAAALLQAAGLSPEANRPLLFKLAALAHALAQGQSGSAVDVAASTWGGTLWTYRAELEPLRAALRASPEAFAAAVDSARAPEAVRLRDPPAVMLAFSGQSASTPLLVQRVEAYARREARGFAEFVARSSAACDRLRRALDAADRDAMIEAVRACGEELEALGARAGIEIVTREHLAIAAAARLEGAAAKTSGAGGGDCAIAVGTSDAIERLGGRLEAEGVLLVREGVDPDGAVVLTAP
jgi:phosphomevalonate kinase